MSISIDKNALRILVLAGCFLAGGVASACGGSLGGCKYGSWFDGGWHGGGWYSGGVAVVPVYNGCKVRCHKVRICNPCKSCAVQPSCY